MPKQYVWTSAGWEAVGVAGADNIPDGSVTPSKLVSTADYSMNNLSLTGSASALKLGPSSDISLTRTGSSAASVNGNVTFNNALNAYGQFTTRQFNFVPNDTAGNVVYILGEGATSGAAIASNWTTGSSYLDLRLGGQTASYTRIRIQTGGGTGIGELSPLARLHVSNTTLDNTAGKHTVYLTENNSDEASGTFNVAKPFYGIGFRRLLSGGDATNIAGIYAWGSGGYRGGLVFRTNNAGGAGSEPNVNALIIEPDGDAVFPAGVSGGTFTATTSFGISGGPTWTNDSGKWQTAANVRIDGAALYLVNNGSTIQFGDSQDINFARTAAGELKLYSSGSVATKYIVKAGASQSTTNLQEWHNNSNVVLSSIDSTGTYRAPVGYKPDVASNLYLAMNYI